MARNVKRSEALTTHPSPLPGEGVRLRLSKGRPLSPREWDTFRGCEPIRLLCSEREV